jgi:hypothetical protein
MTLRNKEKMNVTIEARRINIDFSDTRSLGMRLGRDIHFIVLVIVATGESLLLSFNHHPTPSNLCPKENYSNQKLLEEGTAGLKQ